MASFQTRDGSALHYYDIGTGPVCVMLHGFGMASDLWLPLVAPLLKNNRFILLSQRGFGRSHGQSFTQDCAISQLADDLEDLLQHLDITRCRLAGYSMGACASMQYLASYGESRVQGYLQIDQAVCVAPKHDWEWPLFGEQNQARMADFSILLDQVDTLPLDTTFAGMPKQLRSEVCNAFADFFEIAGHKLWLRKASRLVKLEIVAKLFLPTHNWRAYMHCMKAYHQHNYDFRSGVAGLSLPLWSFVGTESRMYPPEGQLRMGSVAKVPVNVVRFNGCGHALPFEAPRRFSQKLGEFLAAA